MPTDALRQALLRLIEASAPFVVRADMPPALEVEMLALEEAIGDAEDALDEEPDSL